MLSLCDGGSRDGGQWPMAVCHHTVSPCRRVSVVLTAPLAVVVQGGQGDELLHAGQAGAGDGHQGVP